MTTLATDPCEVCADYSFVQDVPPYWVCNASPTLDFECDRWFAVEELEDLAVKFAYNLATTCRHVPAEARLTLAQVIAEGINDALTGVDSRLDIAAFLVLSGFGDGGES